MQKIKEIAVGLLSIESPSVSENKNNINVLNKVFILSHKERNIKVNCYF